MAPSSQYVRFFKDIGIDDVPTVGGKNASLGEMYRNLSGQGVKVPDGFAITAQAYRDMLTQANAWTVLHKVLDGLDIDDPRQLASRAQAAREIVYGAALPPTLVTEILAGYAQLQEQYGKGVTVAVRSSATAEDLPTASFAGQQESFLNVSGPEQLLESCKHCFASLFTDRAIHYRIDQGFDHFKVALSVGVMKMVRSDLATSGVLFTLDTETGFRDVVLISAAYGLGENVVQGNVDPDELMVFKPTFARGARAVLRRRLGSKRIRMVYGDPTAEAPTHNVETSDADRARYCITDEDALRLTDCALRIEKHYSSKAGHEVPMDIEWAKDGVDGELYIVQARPETAATHAVMNIIEEFQLQGRSQVLASGRAVGGRIAKGKVRVIEDAANIASFKPGEILVTDSTSPDWEPVMKHAAGIITNRGGRTCHAAIVAREFGIPAVVGCTDATRVLATGDEVTICCSEGETGKVYRGLLSFEVRRTDVSALPRPKTQMMLIIGNPDLAFRHSFLPNDGVGLARMEFVITHSVGVHPMALVHPERIADESERRAVLERTRHDASPRDFFIRELAEGIGTIAAAFYPKPVIVRMSDFKTNEYSGLLGGRWFETQEANPMIGFRGASRYTHPAYEDGFALECAAMKYVRERLGLDNVKLMIPFCRRIAEGARVIDRMAALGLQRGVDGLEIYMMCEIPNNVMQIDEFSRLFDGFSIGSNDLTQLTLGVDRDSAIVAFDFDERDEGVRRMIRHAVQGCQRNRRHSGLCGQAPSDYPEMAEYLVRLGIDSISLNPDSIIATTRRILALESELGGSEHSYTLQHAEVGQSIEVTAAARHAELGDSLQ